ncbi:MAG: hypothetical protein LBG84_09990 [Treponema sp.]|jgi:hypothetical protein|nr:hypothetical protein [Treponema sp.]
MAANTRHKASVFSLLFSEPGVLRELYSALSGVNVPPETPVTINTLEDALFMDRVNDVSFAIADRLVVLLEHQSTVNPNMALRVFLYAARVYEKITYCRNHNIPREFLKKHATEVLNMITGEWNWDTAKEVWQEEAYERGMAVNAAPLRQEQERLRQEQERVRQLEEEIRRLRESAGNQRPSG